MKKVYILLFVFGLILAGCGTSLEGGGQGNDDGVTSGSGDTGEEVSEGVPGEEGEDENGNSGVASGDLEPSLQQDSGLVYKYKVLNQSENEVTLEFSSSQRYDFSIETKDGEEVYLFSSLAMFLQAEGEEVLKQGEELVYDIDVAEAGLEAGEYVLKVWLTPKSGNMSMESVEFTVE